MTCHDYELALMDVARNAPGTDVDSTAVLAHAKRCARCAAFLRDQRALSRAFEVLASRVSEVRPDPAIEARLRDNWGLEQQPDGEVLRHAVMKVAAALLIVAGGLLAAWWDFEQRPSRPTAAPAEFVPWPGAAALPPFESGELVRTELPASVLPLLGIDPLSAPTVDKVKADLLVGQDGLVRAVRLAN